MGNIRLSDIVANTRPVTFTFQGNEITLNYRPNAYTQREEIRLEGLEGDEKKLFAVNFLMTLLGPGKDGSPAWNLVDDADQPLPLSADNLMELPMLLLGDMFNAIIEDFKPGEATAPVSSAGSFTA